MTLFCLLAAAMRLGAIDKMHIEGVNVFAEPWMPDNSPAITRAIGSATLLHYRDLDLGDALIARRTHLVCL